MSGAITSTPPYAVMACDRDEKRICLHLLSVEVSARQKCPKYCGDRLELVIFISRHGECCERASGTYERAKSAV